MMEMLRWAGLAELVVSVSASALCGLGLAYGLWRQNEAEARARRAAKAVAGQRVVRELAPLLKRLDDHELQLELLAAYAAEARRSLRPSLRLAAIDEEPDLAA